MRRSRRKIDSSSLDLFLDTICNAFGGIMFLALVVAIQISLRGEVSEGQPQDPQNNPSQSRGNLERLELEREQLQQALAIYEQRIQTTGNSMIGELQTKISEYEEKMEQESKQQEEMKEQLAENQAKLQTQQERIRDMERKLSEAKGRLRETADSVEKTVDAKVTKLELPKVRSSNKTPIFFAMRYGKAFLVIDPNTGEAYQPHVTTRVVEESLLVKLKPGGGWTLNNPSDHREFLTHLGSASSRRYYITVAVWPDSYGEFKRFRESLVERDYEYNLVPFKEADELVIATTSVRPGVQ
jgi:hypothetical protein